MSDRLAMLTTYADINEVLQALLEGAQPVLGDHFVGLYLDGSLASGDFNPQTSDIDFVVVTDTDLSHELIHDLEALHTRLGNSSLKWAAKLEGAYVPLSTLRHHDPDAAPCPTINEGRFYLDRPGSDWIIQPRASNGSTSAKAVASRTWSTTAPYVLSGSCADRLSAVTRKHSVLRLSKSPLVCGLLR
jgi:hypothetical protein